MMQISGSDTHYTDRNEMDARVFLPVSARSVPDVWDLLVFLNQQAARWYQGAMRYTGGKGPRRRHRYLSRLKAELAEYERSGNLEQLLNVAVYAYLESQKPENPRFHHNPFTDSATRGKGF